MAKKIASLYVEQRAEMGYPLLKEITEMNRDLFYEIGTEESYQQGISIMHLRK